ncbi:MAG: hypothetical protein ACRCUM_01320 [Mycoplasmoidaceae bacterium]
MRKDIIEKWEKAENDAEKLYEMGYLTKDVKEVLMEINNQYFPILEKFNKYRKMFDDETWFSLQNEEVQKINNEITYELNNLKSVVDDRIATIKNKDNKKENNMNNTNTKKEMNFQGILPKLLTSLKGEEKKNYFRVVLNFNNSAASFENESKDKLKVYLPKTLLPTSFVSDLKERDISYCIVVNKEECGTFETKVAEGKSNEFAKKTILVLDNNKNYVLKRDGDEKLISGKEFYNFLKENKKSNLWDWTPQDFIIKTYNEDKISDDKKGEYFTLRLNKSFTNTSSTDDKQTRFISLPRKLISKDEKAIDLYIAVEPNDVKNYFYINKENNEKVSKYSILIKKDKEYSLFSKDKKELVGKITGLSILNNDVEKKLTKELWVKTAKATNEEEIHFEEEEYINIQGISQK